MNRLWIACRQWAPNPLWDVLAGVVLVLSVGHLLVMLPGRMNTWDFNHYYVSSRLLLDGRNPYTTSLAELCGRYGFDYAEQTPVATNPPGLLWLFAPLAAMTPRAAFWVWVAAQGLSLGVILWLTRRLLGGRLTRRGWWFVCAAAVSSSAVFWNFWFSHVELMLAALVLMAYWWVRTGHGVRACGAVVLAGFLKLFPLAFLPWFVLEGNGNRRTRFQRAGTALMLVAVGLVLTGPALWRDFGRHGLPLVAAWAVNHTFNFSLPSFVANLGMAGSPSATGPGAWTVGWETGLVVGLLTMALGYWWIWRVRQDPETQFCLLCVVLLIAEPVTWGYYLVFAIFPLVVMAVRVAQHPGVGRVAGVVVVFLLVNSLDTWITPYLNAHRYLKVLANYLPLYGLLGLGGFFVGERWRRA